MTLTTCPVALDIKNHKLDERKPIVVEYSLAPPLEADEASNVVRAEGSVFAVGSNC